MPKRRSCCCGLRCRACLGCVDSMLVTCEEVTLLSQGIYTLRFTGISIPVTRTAPDVCTFVHPPLEPFEVTLEYSIDAGETWEEMEGIVSITFHCVKGWCIPYGEEGPLPSFYRATLRFSYTPPPLSGVPTATPHVIFASPVFGCPQGLALEYVGLSGATSGPDCENPPIDPIPASIGPGNEWESVNVEPVITV